jgi:endonuclease IV
MSIAGGLHLALERGKTTGCSVVQLFVKNQVQWAARPLTDEDVRRFKKARPATGIAEVFAHSTYLINLATPAEAEWRRAVDAFADELERAEALGLRFVVIHPGSHKGSGLEAGISRIVAALDELAGRIRGYRVRIALENTAGAGHTVGARFEELQAVREKIVVLDVAHAAHADRAGVFPAMARVNHDVANGMALEHAHRKLAVCGCEGQTQGGGSRLARNAWRAEQDGKYRGAAFGGDLQTPQLSVVGALGPCQNRGARIGSQRLLGCPQRLPGRARSDEDEPGEIDSGAA